ncbi:MAG: c-type cytochrome, partial [Planctomycetes bacterium]|nr:c-type cytochrome [Planctomycetota bacterium]
MTETRGPDDVQRLADAYSAGAAGYAESWSPVIHPIGQRLIEALPWSSARRVLDIATGAGAHVPDVRRWAPGAWVVGVDRSPGMLKLARQHDGKDRWYLEALGIGADRQWDAYFDAWLKAAGEKWNTPAGRDIVWRSRAARTAQYLAKIISDPSTPTSELPRYFRAFDFQTGSGKNRVLAGLAFGELVGDEVRQNLIVAESLTRLKNFDARSNPEHTATLDRLLDKNRGSARFIDFITRFSVERRYPELLPIAQKNPEEQLGVNAIRALLDKNQGALIRKGLDEKDVKVALATAQVLGSSGDERAVGLLLAVVQDAKRPIELRRQATRSLAKSRNGARQLLRLARAKELDDDLKEAAGFALSVATWNDVKKQAAELFPLPPAKNNKPLPPVSTLVKMRGRPEQGKMLFNTTGTCATCHIVNGTGKEVGPDLSEIGKKLSRESMYESILYPSAGITHGYETYALETKKGNVLNGLLVSQTPAEVTLKGADAIVRTFKRSEIESLQKVPVSLMPADLQKLLTAEDLADVVEYMLTLKQAQKPKK